MIEQTNSAALEAKESTAMECGTLLVVEDDPRMQKVLTRMFQEEQYRVVVAGDGQAGLDAFIAHHPVAVVLDLILPLISGRELCKRLKDIADETPIIVLSAITEVVDKVLLLELGADDYVTKPLARVSSRRVCKLRFAAAGSRLVDSTYRFADCEIDFVRITARKAETSVILTAHEFKLLRFFTQRPERVFKSGRTAQRGVGLQLLPDHPHCRQPDPETAAEARGRPCESTSSADDLRSRLQVCSILRRGERPWMWAKAHAPE